MPGIHGQLAGNERRPRRAAIIDHVQQLPGVGDGQRDQAPLIEQQQVCLGEPDEHPGIGAVRLGDPEVRE